MPLAGPLLSAGQESGGHPPSSPGHGHSHGGDVGKAGVIKPLLLKRHELWLQRGRCQVPGLRVLVLDQRSQCAQLVWQGASGDWQASEYHHHSGHTHERVIMHALPHSACIDYDRLDDCMLGDSEAQILV